MIKWTDEAMALLGTVPDQQIADLLGCSASSIAIHRKMRDIPSYRRYRRTHPARPAYIEWTDEALEALGTVPDEVVAEMLECEIRDVWLERNRLGVPPYVFGREWSEEQLALLGTMPDKDLAIIIGCSAQSVTRKRRQLGIPRHHVGVWTDEALALLGKVSDGEVADRVGVSSGMVTLKRKELNIPAYHPKRWQGLYATPDKRTKANQ